MLLSIWTEFALNCSSPTQVWLWQYLLPLALSLTFSLSLRSTNPPVLVPLPSLVCPQPPQCPVQGHIQVCSSIHIPSHATRLRLSERKPSNSTSVCPKPFSFDNRAAKQVATQKGIWGERGRAQVSRLGHQKQQKRGRKSAGSRVRWHYGLVAALAALCTFKLLLRGFDCSPMSQAWCRDVSRSPPDCAVPPVQLYCGVASPHPSVHGWDIGQEGI